MFKARRARQRNNERFPLTLKKGEPKCRKAYPRNPPQRQGKENAPPQQIRLDYKNRGEAGGDNDKKRGSNVLRIFFRKTKKDRKPAPKLSIFLQQEDSDADDTGTLRTASMTASHGGLSKLSMGSSLAKTIDGSRCTLDSAASNRSPSESKVTLNSAGSSRSPLTALREEAAEGVSPPNQGKSDSDQNSFDSTLSNTLDDSNDESQSSSESGQSPVGRPLHEPITDSAAHTIPMDSGVRSITEPNDVNLNPQSSIRNEIPPASSNELQKIDIESKHTVPSQRPLEMKGKPSQLGGISMMDMELNEAAVGESELKSYILEDSMARYERLFKMKKSTLIMQNLPIPSSNMQRASQTETVDHVDADSPNSSASSFPSLEDDIDFPVRRFERISAGLPDNKKTNSKVSSKAFVIKPSRDATSFMIKRNQPELIQDIVPFPTSSSSLPKMSQNKQNVRNKEAFEELSVESEPGLVFSSASSSSEISYSSSSESSNFAVHYDTESDIDIEELLSFAQTKPTTEFYQSLTDDEFLSFIAEPSIEVVIVNMSFVEEHFRAKKSKKSNEIPQSSSMSSVSSVDSEAKRQLDDDSIDIPTNAEFIEGSIEIGTESNDEKSNDFKNLIKVVPSYNRLRGMMDSMEKEMTSLNTMFERKSMSKASIIESDENLSNADYSSTSILSFFSEEFSDEGGKFTEQPSTRSLQITTIMEEDENGTNGGTKREVGQLLNSSAVAVSNQRTAGNPPSPIPERNLDMASKENPREKLTKTVSWKVENKVHYFRPEAKQYEVNIETALSIIRSYDPRRGTRAQPRRSTSPPKTPVLNHRCPAPSNLKSCLRKASSLPARHLRDQLDSSGEDLIMKKSASDMNLTCSDSDLLDPMTPITSDLCANLLTPKPSSPSNYSCNRKFPRDEQSFTDLPIMDQTFGDIPTSLYFNNNSSSFSSISDRKSKSSVSTNSTLSSGSSKLSGRSSISDDSGLSTESIQYMVGRLKKESERRRRKARERKQKESPIMCP